MSVTGLGVYRRPEAMVVRQIDTVSVITVVTEVN
jgi:hypothetical protein